MSEVTKAAEIVAAARRERTPLAGLPADVAPAHVEAGYAIQRAFVDLWDDDVAGWKVGATAPAAMAAFGADEPFYGPVFAGDIVESPARLRTKGRHFLGVEGEFAFVLGRDVEPATNRTRDDVAAYVETARIAIEFVSPRLDKPGGYGVAQLIADTAGNGAVVLGPEIAHWRKEDLAARAVRLGIDGEEKGAGTGADVLGHPLEALTWFTNRAGGHGQTVRAGAVVITGAATGLIVANPGSHVVADFGDLGEVVLDLV